jgi:hypothetical protein
MEATEIKNKMITLRITEGELVEIKTLAKIEQRSVAGFFKWLVSEYKKKYGIGQG